MFHVALVGCGLEVCEGGKKSLAFVNLSLNCEGDNKVLQLRQRKGDTHKSRDPLDILDKSASYRG